MPAITPPTQTEIDSWHVEERGVRDGSSPEEAFEVDASSATRVFHCKWEHRAAFVQWMIGYSQTWDDAGTTKLSRLLPQQHPDYPDLIAVKARLRGFRWMTNSEPDVEPDPPDEPYYQFTESQINVFDKADVTVEYAHADYDRASDDLIYGGGFTEMDRFVIRGEVTPSGEYLQLPGASLKYFRSTGVGAPHGQAINFNAGKVLPGEKFTLTWTRLPDAVWTPESGLYQLIYGTGPFTAVPYLGCVNKTEFYGRYPGTVLLDGVRPIRRKSPLGAGFEWDLEYSFNFDPNGWNWKYYYDPTGGASGWYFVGNTQYYAPGSLPDDKAVYNEAELLDLFSVNN